MQVKDPPREQRCAMGPYFRDLAHTPQGPLRPPLGPGPQGHLRAAGVRGQQHVMLGVMLPGLGLHQGGVGVEGLQGGGGQQGIGLEGWQSIGGQEGGGGWWGCPGGGGKLRLGGSWTSQGSFH